MKNNIQFGICLPKELVEKFDKFIKNKNSVEGGSLSRSQYIQKAMTEFMVKNLDIDGRLKSIDK